MSESKKHLPFLSVTDFFAKKEGIPKVCVPLVGRNHEELLAEITEANLSEADLVEWRADFYLDDIKIDAILEMLAELRKKTHLPILFTFRTRHEGGEKEIDELTYQELLVQVAAAKKTQFIDVEIFQSEERVKAIIKELHRLEQVVIASNHDFNLTPSYDELIRRMRLMDECGADVLKIACMPRCMSDVVEVLKATTLMQEKYTSKPIISMSMGELGSISRYSGEIFGSVLTFGALREVSAPGQLHIKELKEILEHIHHIQTRSSS